MSVTKMDPRPSRRVLLSSILVDHLLLMAREWLFDDYHSIPVVSITKVLESAAARVNNESGWLLDKMRSKGPIPEFGSSVVSKRAWLADITHPVASDDSPRAKYYLGRATLGADNTTALEMLRRSAEAGFAPAMGVLGWSLFHLVWNKEEGMAWLRKAAELNDPDGLFYLSCLKNDRQLLQLSVARGNLLGMYYTANDNRSSLAEAATFGARYLVRAGVSSLYHFRNDALNFIRSHGNGVESLQARFAVGRELEGYEQFWDDGRHLGAIFHGCIDLYLSALHSARRAALQTVVGLREIGLPRDVAVLIGRVVFDEARSGPAGEE